MILFKKIINDIKKYLNDREFKQNLNNQQKILDEKL